MFARFFDIASACIALIALSVVTSPVSAAADTLQATVDAVAHHSPMDRAQLGVYAVEMATNHVLATRQADHPFTPASTFKVLLAATALDLLGPQFRFTTRLLARGTIEGGVLQGDLILIGGGDPVLTSHDLADAVSAVARAGIREVRGTLLADTSLFDQRRWGPDWAWDGTPFYYEAPIQALSIDEGTIGVVIKPGSSTGDPVTASLLSPSADYTVAPLATMGSSPYDNPERCSRLIDTKQILIVGRMPLGASEETVHCAVDDTADFALKTLRSAFATNGVRIGTSPLGPRPPNTPLDVIDDSSLAKLPWTLAPPIWIHESPPLIELLHTMLPKSDNFIAEHFLKMLAVHKLSQRGNFIGGATVEQRFAVQHLAVNPDSIDAEDGSGLSSADRITPRTLVAILRSTAKQSYGNDFINALARAGVDGTLANRLTGTDAVGRVHAKSGYMQHAIALTGYADTFHHGRVAFAIMINDATGDPGPYFDLEDQIVVALVDLQ
jgi:serine-type D-Ala-D-Ala carboxypeptidase/endopeptidase (penicillin-binding protein 4)